MSSLIERLNAGVPCSGTHATSDDVDAADATMAEAATALAEQATRIAELEAEAIIAPAECSPDCDDRDCPYSHTPLTLRRAYENSLSRLRDAESRLATLQSELDEARGALRRCNWYWPEEDTSSETCADSAQEVVQNAYDWSSKMAGEVVPVARGGIVEVTYCASLPPDGDADSDDDFWVKETTAAAAQAKIDAELARRAATRTTGGDNGE